MVPQLPITVFKVRLHESHYRTGFLDLQSFKTFFFFFLLIFTGMAKITFFSAHSSNHVRIYIQPWILMTTFDLKKLLFLSCEPHADITESFLFGPSSLLF